MILNGLSSKGQPIFLYFQRVKNSTLEMDFHITFSGKGTGYPFNGVAAAYYQHPLGVIRNKIKFYSPIF
jgi:hypothetical protein